MEVQVDGRRAARQARARGRLVPVGRDAAAGGADDPERHQSAAVRDAQGHHGGEEERDPQGAPRRPRRRRGRRSSALYVPEKTKKTQMIAGSPAEAAKELVAGCATRRGSICMILVVAEQRGGTLNRATLGSRSRRRSSSRGPAQPTSRSLIAGRAASQAVAAELAAAAVARGRRRSSTGARAVHARRLHGGAAGARSTS